jgi:hypothetical protein
MYYYCGFCEAVHLKDEAAKRVIIFTSSFRYFKNVKYPFGYCEKYLGIKDKADNDNKE